MNRKTVAQVASIEDDFTIIINKGFLSGINANQLYYIVEVGDPIIDPETGRELERLERVKGWGKASHIQETIATIKSTQTQRDSAVRKTIRKKTGALTIFGDEVTEEIDGPDFRPVPFERVKIGDKVMIFEPVGKQ